MPFQPISAERRYLAALYRAHEALDELEEEQRLYREVCAEHGVTPRLFLRLGLLDGQLHYAGTA